MELWNELRNVGIIDRIYGVGMNIFFHFFCFFFGKCNHANRLLLIGRNPISLIHHLLASAMRRMRRELILSHAK